MRCKIT